MKLIKNLFKYFFLSGIVSAKVTKYTWNYQWKEKLTLLLLAINNYILNVYSGEDWKCGSRKCDTKNISAVENAGLEKAIYSKGGESGSKIYGILTCDYIGKALILLGLWLFFWLNKVCLLNSSDICFCILHFCDCLIFPTQDCNWNKGIFACNGKKHIRVKMNTCATYCLTEYVHSTKKWNNFTLLERYYIIVK